MYRSQMWLKVSSYSVLISIALYSMLCQQSICAQIALNATTIPSSNNMFTTRPDFLTYKNITYGIEIKYPSSWKANENVSGNGRNLDVVKFVSSLPGNPTLVVSRDSVSPNETVDLYLAEVIQALTSSSDHPGFTLISTDTHNTNLAGNAGYELLYSNRDPSSDNVLLNDEIGTIIGDKVYYVTYVAAEPEYSTYKPIINQMISSLIIFVSNEMKSTVHPNKLGITGIPIAPSDVAET